MAEPQILYTTPRPQTRTHIKKPKFIIKKDKYIFKNYNILFNGRPITSISGLNVKHVYLYDTEWIVDWYFINYPTDNDVTFIINGSWHREWSGEYYHLQLNIISHNFKLQFANPIHLIRLDNGTGMQTDFTSTIKLGDELILRGMGMGWDIYNQDATTGRHCDIFPVAGQYTGQHNIQGNPILIPDTQPGQLRTEASKYHYILSTDWLPKYYKDETQPPRIIYDPYLSFSYFQNQGQGKPNPKSRKPKSRKPKPKSRKPKPKPKPKSRKPKPKSRKH